MQDSTGAGSSTRAQSRRQRRQRKKESKKNQGTEAPAASTSERDNTEERSCELSFLQRMAEIYPCNEMDVRKVARLMLDDNSSQADGITAERYCVARILDIDVERMKDNDFLFEAALLLMDYQSSTDNYPGAALLPWKMMLLIEPTDRVRHESALHLLQATINCQGKDFAYAALNLAQQNYCTFQQLTDPIVGSLDAENKSIYGTARRHVVNYAAIAFFGCAAKNKWSERFSQDIKLMMEAVIGSYDEAERQALLAQDAQHVIKDAQDVRQVNETILVLYYLSRNYGDKSRKQYQMALRCLDKLKEFAAVIEQQQSSSIGSTPVSRILNFEEQMRTWLDRKIKAAERSKASNVVATDNVAALSEDDHTHSSGSPSDQPG